MSSFGALISKLQYVKHVAFFFGTPGIKTQRISKIFKTQLKHFLSDPRKLTNFDPILKYLVDPFLVVSKL